MTRFKSFHGLIMIAYELSYILLYKYGRLTRNFLEAILLLFPLVFYHTGTF